MAESCGDRPLARRSSPSTPGRPGCGPWWWTSRPGWWTSPTGSSPSTSRTRGGSSTNPTRSGTPCARPWTRWPVAWPTSGRVARALGITNQRETVVAWDRDSGRPLHRAIVWQDRRTAGRCQELTEAGLLPMVRERTGLVLDPYFSATKMEWLLGHGRGAGRPRAGPRHGRLLGAVEPDRGRPGRGVRHRHHQRGPHPPVRHRVRRWSDELREVFGVPEGALPRGASVLRTLRPGVGGAPSAPAPPFGTCR